MQPYVIRSNDYLLKLAYRFGFDADTVWQDAKNAALRLLRPNPNVLFAGDVLYIPDPSPTQPDALITGDTNNFSTTVPTVPVTVCFSDADYASKPYTIAELPELTRKQTEADGSLTIAIPVNLECFTVSFTDPAATFTCELGRTDPINTLSGIFQRLQNLGFIDPNEDLDPSQLDVLRYGLRRLKASQPEGASPPPSSPPSSPAAADDYAATGETPESTGTDVAATDEADADAGPASDALGPSPDDPPGPAVLDAAPDFSGLSDDGTLDDATTALLLNAHGS